MRCEDFDNVVCELVRDGLVDAALRDKALSHAVSCDRCSSRHAAERHLNEALAIAAAAETECAPPSVKLSLLQAFSSRERVSSAGSSPAARRRYAAAAAAALVAIVAVISVRIITRRQFVSAQPTVPDEQLSLKAPTQPRTGLIAVDPVPGGNKPVNNPQRGLGRSLRHSGQGPDHWSPVTGIGRTGSESEALSDFIPLTHLSSATAIESGQVIRVKVPLSAFLAFGLPVSPEHADQLVNAEVVVGDDGVERAVRLVR